MTNFVPEQLAQAINPWSWWFKSSDNMTGFVNIANYKSSNPEIEHQIVHEVAGYGMQLDVIEELLGVMLETMPKTQLDKEQQKRVDAFKEMMAKITAKKERAAVEQLSSGGVEKLLEGLALLKEKHPERYAVVAKQLKNAL